MSYLTIFIISALYGFFGVLYIYIEAILLAKEKQCICQKLKYMKYVYMISIIWPVVCVAYLVAWCVSSIHDCVTNYIIMPRHNTINDKDIECPRVFCRYQEPDDECEV
jgi:hypothetical protein